jgi:hypothetical protein
MCIDKWIFTKCICLLKSCVLDDEHGEKKEQIISLDHSTHKEQSPKVNSCTSGTLALFY